MLNPWLTDMSFELSFEIKRSDANDLASVMIIMADAFDPKFGEAWTASQCESMLMLPGSVLLIAYADEQPAAFALMRSFAGEAELLLIATRPFYQRRDIGKALIKRLLADCLSAQINLMHLEVRADNPALSFYLHTGFEQVGIRKNYYRGARGYQSDAITLNLHIS
jgi:[ribosomal protein S18]-alanine N-acetyltransferase